MNAMSIPNEALHAQALEMEMEWLATVINARLLQHFEQKPDAPLVPAPVPPTESAWSSLLSEGDFAQPERLVLALALAPHLRPEILDVLFVQNQNLNRGFTEFGGLKGIAYGGFIPTGETAAFLVAGASLHKRLELMRILGPEHPFSRRNILNLAPPEKGEPALRGRLAISDEWLKRLCGSTAVKPNLSSEFPAALCTTPLGFEQLVVDAHIQDQLQFLLSWNQRNEEWMHTVAGLAQHKRGLVALLHGPAGVGKTFSATLLGKQSRADVYKVDLRHMGGGDTAQVQSGLARLFDMATARRWILLFENSDVLLENTSSATQASNVACLRHHLKGFAGLALLESRRPLDAESAHMDPVDMAIKFEWPDYGQRLQLWRAHLPEDRAGGYIRMEDLAQCFKFTGAQIADVVYRASLKAAQRHDPLVYASDLRECAAGIARF